MDIALLILTIVSIMLSSVLLVVFLTKKTNQNALEKSDLTMVTDFLDRTLKTNGENTQQALDAFRKQLYQSIQDSQNNASQLRTEIGKQLDGIRDSLILTLDKLQKDNNFSITCLGFLVKFSYSRSKI